MHDNARGRLTIDKIDPSTPTDEWKLLLADYGHRRHLSFTMDFDTHVFLLEEPAGTREELPRKLHFENREKLKAQLEREFGLALLRNRSIHFNVSTYTTPRDDAIAALLHLREIIDQQFTASGDRPWFIKGTIGHVFIARAWETNPFIKTYYLPSCPLVGPYFAISNEGGWRFHDQDDYRDGEWTDKEFAQAYNTRTPDQVVPTE